MSWFEWDSEVDAAYIQFRREIRNGEAVRQVEVALGPGLEYEAILDLDESGHILGLELIGATAALGEQAIQELLRLRDG